LSSVREANFTTFNAALALVEIADVVEIGGGRYCQRNPVRAGGNGIGTDGGARLSGGVQYELCGGD
jgi:hypothetical protein